MLLQHKLSGDVYSYHKVLMDSGDFKIFESPPPIEIAPVAEVRTVKHVRRQRKNLGETNGAETL